MKANDIEYDSYYPVLDSKRWYEVRDIRNNRWIYQGRSKAAAERAYNQAQAELRQLQKYNAEQKAVQP